MTSAPRPADDPARPGRSPAARERQRIREPLLSVAALAASLLLVDTIAGGGHHTPAPFTEPLAAASALAGWAVMVTAMTAPLLGPPLQHVRARSLTRDRTRACVRFLAGFGAVWLVLGLVLTSLAALLAAVPAAAVAAAGTALLWWTTPARDRCLNRRHRHPALPAFGAAAGRAATRFGVLHGVWCAGTCWAPMLLMLLLPAPAGLAVMLAATAWLAAEALEAPARPGWGIRWPRVAARIAPVPFPRSVRPRPGRPARPIPRTADPVTTRAR